MPVIAPVRRLAVALVLLAGLAGCSRGEAAPTATADAAQTLQRARATLEAIPAVHFVLTSGSVPKVPAALLGGEGDAARPDRFKGRLDVRFAGAQASVEVVSTAGTLYAKLPFAAGFSTVDPAQFGLSDPGTLLSADRGLTQLLAAATDATFGPRTRAGAEVVRTVTARIPGATVAKVLTTRDPAAAVPVEFGIVEGSGQLRRATLTGPFFDAATKSTYTLVLDRYGQQVQISAPAR